MPHCSESRGYSHRKKREEQEAADKAKREQDGKKEKEMEEKKKARAEKEKQAAEKTLEDARKASKSAMRKVATAAAAVAKFGPAMGTPTPPSAPSPTAQGRASVAAGLTPLARVQLVANDLTVLMIVDLFPAHLCLEDEWQPSIVGVWVAEAFYHLFDGEEVSLARLAKLRVTFTDNKETVCFQAQAVLPTTAQYVPILEALLSNMVSKEPLPAGVSAREAEEAVESVFENNRLKWREGGGSERCC